MDNSLGIIINSVTFQIKDKFLSSNINYIKENIRFYTDCGATITLDLTKVEDLDSDTMEFIFNHKGSKIMPLDSKVTERYLDYVNSRHEVEVK